DDFTRAIELDPKSGDAYHFRARAFERRLEYAKAMRDWSEYARIEERNPQAQRPYAHRLATSVDASLRNGRRAVEIANRACELSQWKDVDCLETLAAAYAQSGDYPAAIKWETKAIQLIAHDLPSAPRLKEFMMRERLKSYQNQQPYHQ